MVPNGKAVLRRDVSHALSAPIARTTTSVDRPPRGGAQSTGVRGGPRRQRAGSPQQFRRNDLRSADMHTNINYYATVRVANRESSSNDGFYTAPDDRKNKEASWLARRCASRACAITQRA